MSTSGATKKPDSDAVRKLKEYTPAKELMKLTPEQKIAHNEHTVIRWNMGSIYDIREMLVL